MTVQSPLKAGVGRAPKGSGPLLLFYAVNRWVRFAPDGPTLWSLTTTRTFGFLPPVTPTCALSAGLARLVERLP